MLQLILAALGWALLTLGAEVCAASFPVIPKWHRFELTLTSRHAYTNALQEAEVRVLFVSPLGETNRTYGFWDGGKTWRVRFAPNFPGRWRYYTMCSDPANPGLNGQAGEFLCIAATGDSRFDEHGPIQVARDQEHFEQADRTPFLWLGDAAWDAPPRATDSDWKQYAQTRAAQKFNTVQWRLAPAAATAAARPTPEPYTGRECITLNLGFFQHLDAKVDGLTRAGLLNAIAPLWEIGARADQSLPEDQAIILLRYAVARWGGNPVAWIVAFESDSTGEQAARWQRIGRAVFNPVTHGPVIVLPGEAPWVLPAFRKESWADALGFQTTQVTDEDALPWLIQGPLSLERQKLPVRPLITLSPAVELLPAEAREQPDATNFVRRVLWWSLLINTPAGVSYSTRDVADWTRAKTDAAEPPWRTALSMPGAEAMAPLAECFGAIDFWRLKPVAQGGMVRSGTSSLSNPVAASSTDGGNLLLIYMPAERAFQLPPGSWAVSENATWLDPSTGQRRPAAAVVASPAGWEFTKPDGKDWVLVVRARR